MGPDDQDPHLFGGHRTMPVIDLWHHMKTSGHRHRGCSSTKLPTKRHGRGQQYKVQWNDPLTKKPVSRAFNTKREADDFWAEIRGNGGVTKGEMSIEAWGERWLTGRRKVADSTRDRMERALRLHLFPKLGKVKLNEVTPLMIDDWVNALIDTPLKKTRRPMKASTLHVLYGYVDAMFGAAVDLDQMDRSPCRKSIEDGLPEKVGKQRHSIRRSDVEKLAAAFAEGRLPRYAALPVVAAGSGLREAELWALEPHHIDLDQRKIVVAQQLKDVPGLRSYLSERLKSKSSRRTVEITPAAAEALRQHMVAFPPVGITITREDQEGERRPGAATLIFTTQSGRPIDRSTWSRAWHTARKRVGLPERFSLHDLRHYFATVALENGSSLGEVSRALGHSNPSVTARLYWGDPHEDDRGTRSPAEAVGQAWSKPGEEA